MTPLIASLLAAAVALSGYPAPSQEPTVSFVPHHVLEAMACSSGHCPIKGWTPPGDTVYVDAALNMDDVVNQSIVVHELIHVLQNESGKYPFPHTCFSTIKTEREAYGVQSAFLEQHGSDFYPQVPPIWALCPTGPDA